MSLEIGHDSSDRLGRAFDDGESVRLSERGLMARLSGLFFTKRNSLLIFGLMPSIVAAMYYSLMASDQYVAEMRMIVRTIGVSEQFDTSEKREGRSMIGGDSLTQDSYIVANYLKSPEIVRKLDAEMGLREYVSRADIDWLSRLSQYAPFEELYRYWVRQVDTYVDGPSGIIIFTVRAFSPEDSVRIANAALAAADGMVDKISEKAKRDLVARVEGDVNASLDGYRAALDDLRNYQNKTGILDPL